MLSGPAFSWRYFTLATLVILGLGGSLVVPSPAQSPDLGEEYYSRLGAMSGLDVPDVPHDLPFYDPESSCQIGNLCQLAKVRDNDNPEFTRRDGSALTAVVDDDPGTFLTKRVGPGDWLEIRFAGPHRWVNILEIEYSGDVDFQVEVFDWRGERHEVNVLDSFSRAVARGHELRTIEIDPVRAQGMRWSVVGAASTPKTVEIHEISAWFSQVDPDGYEDYAFTSGHGTTQDPSRQPYWLLCETGPWIPFGELTGLWWRITALPNWCPATPHWCHFWAWPGDWSDDFRIASRGGGENMHNAGWTGMDHHDLSVIDTRGAPLRMRFTTGPPTTQSRLRAPYDVSDAGGGYWGDQNAEWFCAKAGRAYGSSALYWLQWATAFNGLHQQNGFITGAFLSGGWFHRNFAEYMISRGVFDPPIPIHTSWFMARARSQPAGTSVISLTTNPWNWLDHLWGQGYVSPDPVPPFTRIYALWDPSLENRDLVALDNPLQLSPEEAASIRGICSGPSSVTLPAGSPEGITVKTTQEVLDSESRTEMTVYTLVPQLIDQTVIDGAVVDLCSQYGIFCSPETGQDEDGAWAAGDGPFGLWGDPHEGSVQFVNSDEYVVAKETPPVLPGPLPAKARSEALLSLLGMAPLMGTYENEFTLNVQTVFDTTGTLIPESSFDLSTNVEYHRVVDGYDVFGPGGYISVTWGDTSDNVPQHFTRGAWHDLVDPISLPVITELEALNQLSLLGDEATIGGIPGICEELLVEGLELAYYNTNGEYETDILEPIYHLWGFCATAEDTLPTELFLPALHLMPQIEITEPNDGDTYSQFDPITFVCQVHAGTPPYTVTWVSAVTESILQSVSGVIDGDTLVYADLAPYVRDDSLLAQAVVVTAVDQNDMESSDDVRILIIPATGIDLPGGTSLPAAFHLAQCTPNPFAGRTEIRYALPVESDVSLTIYDSAGRIVRTLVDEREKAGYKSVYWDGRNGSGISVAGGVYFYRLRAGSYGEVRKMVFVK